MPIQSCENKRLSDGITGKPPEPREGETWGQMIKRMFDESGTDLKFSEFRQRIEHWDDSASGRGEDFGI